MHEIKTLMPVKKNKRSFFLAMPELEVTGVDERWRGGSTTRKPPPTRKRTKQNKTNLCMYNPTEH